MEWFSTFCDFRRRTHFCRSGIFYEINSKNVANFAANYSITVLKITESLKLNIFLKICQYLPFTSKSNCLYSIGPQNEQDGFFTWTKKKNHFFKIFFFIKSNKTFLRLAQNPVFCLLCADFWVIVKMFWACAKFKSNISMSNFGTTWQVPNFFSSTLLAMIIRYW